jgi:hypothetical protein
MYLRLIFISLLFMAPLVASAEVTIRNSEYELHLDKDWIQVQCDNKEQVSFISKSQNAQLRIMVIDYKEFFDYQLKPEQMEKAAKALVLVGIKEEYKRSNGRTVTITNQLVSKIDRGYRADYSGRDSTNRSFKFIGIALPDKALNVLLEMPSQFENQLEPIAQFVLGHFTY